MAKVLQETKCLVLRLKKANLTDGAPVSMGFQADLLHLDGAASARNEQFTLLFSPFFPLLLQMLPTLLSTGILVASLVRWVQKSIAVDALYFLSATRGQGSSAASRGFEEQVLEEVEHDLVPEHDHMLALDCD